MSKKKFLGGCMLIVAVALLGAGYFFGWFEPLKRDRDREFYSGSKIELTEVTENQEEALYKLCKVWGFVKYHHVSVLDGTLNWDAELFRVMPEVLSAENEHEVNKVLLKWLKQFPFEKEESKESKGWKELDETAGIQKLDTSWIDDTNFLGAELAAYLHEVSQTYITNRGNAYASFEKDEIYVSMDNEKDYPMKDEDDGMRLLSVFRFWNMYEYYSPNIEITKKDWDKVLKDTISEMLEAENYEDYVRTLAHMTAQTGDAHITIVDREYLLWNYYGKYYLPCSVKFVDGQMVVVQAAEGQEGEKGLKPGDILLEVDSMTIEERIEELSAYKALPNTEKLLAQMGRQLLQAKEASSEVKVKRDGKERRLQVQNSGTQHSYENPYTNGLMEQDKIGYIDPSKLKEGELETLMETFSDTEGIIVDLRYYPSVFLPYLLGEYITPEPVEFVKFICPNQAIPGSFISQTAPSGKGVMKELMGSEEEYPTYNGKVMLLMDEESASQSEFTIMALRQSPNAVVIGSPSLGADGNIVSVVLPGKVKLNFTGLGILTPEGTQTQRVGLTPDVECYPTIEGLKEERDELVEKAVEMILSE